MIPQISSGEIFPSSVKVRDRVLVVDDEPLVRWALTASLTAAGYDVATATTAGDALELASRVPHPSVVLLDLRPRDHESQPLLDAIRKATPLSHILVLTTERRVGAPAGWLGVEVIEKPFDLSEVVRLVGEAVHR